jgi:DNA-binding MarR family transcriptional regulator
MVGSSFLHRMFRASQAAEQRLVAALVDTKLTPRQIIVLDAIAKNEGANQTGILNMTRVDRSTLSCIVARLAKQGLIVHSKGQKRSSTLSTSFEGRRQLKRAIETMTRVQYELLSAIPASDRDELFKALRLIVAPREH